VGSNLEENTFNVGALIKKNSHALVIGELFLFKGLAILPSTCAFLLTWWQIDES
jgi:hypothetical protein